MSTFLFDVFMRLHAAWRCNNWRKTRCFLPQEKGTSPVLAPKRKLNSVAFGTWQRSAGGAWGPCLVALPRSGCGRWRLSPTQGSPLSGFFVRTAEEFCNFQQMCLAESWRTWQASEDDELAPVRLPVCWDFVANWINPWNWSIWNAQTIKLTSGLPHAGVMAFCEQPCRIILSWSWKCFSALEQLHNCLLWSNLRQRLNMIIIYLRLTRKQQFSHKFCNKKVVVPTQVDKEPIFLRASGLFLLMSRWHTSWEWWPVELRHVFAWIYKGGCRSFDCNLPTFAAATEDIARDARGHMIVELRWTW